MTISEPWFIADVPIKDPSQDAFGHRDVADNLRAMIQGPTPARLLIGLLGPFGVGKSSVIELLKSSLHHDKTHSVVRVSAERHEQVGLHRSLIYSFAEQLVAENCIAKNKAEEILAELEYKRSVKVVDPLAAPLFTLAGNLRRSAGRLWRRLATWALAVLALVAAVLIFLHLFGVRITHIWVVSSALVASTVVTWGPVVLGIFRLKNAQTWLQTWLKPGENTTERPRVEAADEFERVFAKLVNSVTKSVVIAVDDIDRLSASGVLDALNAIRSFQLTCPAEKRPVFVVSADETVIRKAIKDADPGVADVPKSSAADTAAAFLDRLFLQRQQMPPHTRRDLRGYAKNLLAEGNHAGNRVLGSELDGVLAVLIHDAVQDPRHVIRLLNAFFGDYRLAHHREQHTNTRAISPGEVTGHPRMLAQVTAIKVDFPDYFDRLLDDADLIRLVADAVKTGDTAELQKREIPCSGTHYESLARYVGRTAGFVGHVVDLLPFIYLGQDEIDRIVGSRHATELRTLMVNAQFADLRALISRLSDGGDRTLFEGVAPLALDILERVTDIELTNTLDSLTYIADSLPEHQWADLADTVAGALATATFTNPDLDGVVSLAMHASQPHLSKAIAETLIEHVPGEVDRPRVENALRHRADIATILGVPTLTSYLTDAADCYGQSGTYDDVRSWFDNINTSDNDDLYPLTAALALEVIDRVEDEPDQRWCDQALSFFDQRGPERRADSVGRMQKLLQTEPTSQAGQLALLAFNKIRSDNPQELADMAVSCYVGLLDMEDASLTATTTRNYDFAVLELLSTAIERAASMAVNVNDEQINVAIVVARLARAMLRTFAGEDPPQPFIELLNHLFGVSAVAGSQLAEAFIDAWTNDGVDGDASIDSTLLPVVIHLDSIEEPARSAFRSALFAMLSPANGGDTGSPWLQAVVAPIASSETGMTWLRELVPTVTSSIVYNDRIATQRASVNLQILFATERIPDDLAPPAFQAYMNLYNYGVTDLANQAICVLPWPSNTQPQALSALAQYSSSLTPVDYANLLHQLSSRPPSSLNSELTSGLRDAIAQAIADTAPSEGMAKVIAMLPIADAVTLSLMEPAFTSAAVETIEKAGPSERSLNEAIERVTAGADWHGAAASKNPARLQIMQSIHDAYPDLYNAAISRLVDQQLDGDEEKRSDAWYVTLDAMNSEEIQGICDRVASSLTNSKGDVERSREITAGLARCEAHRDQIVRIAADSLQVWIRDRQDSDVSAMIAAALAVDATAAQKLRQAINPRPRRTADGREAWQAAANELGSRT